MRFMWIRFIGALPLALLAACGGGSREASPERSDDMKAVRVVLDAGVHASVRTRVATVISAVDEKPLAVGLGLAEQVDGSESLIVAVDASDRMLLAALDGGSDTVLSSRSTAIALARLVLGRSAFGGTADRIDAFIARSPADFDTLVQRIEAAHASGTPPDEDAAVMAALAGVIAEQHRSAVKLAGETERQRASFVAKPRIGSTASASPLPATVLDATYLGVPLAVKVTSALPNGSVKIVNATPAYWAVGSTDQNGTSLPVPDTGGASPVVDGRVVIEGIGIGNALVENGVDHWLLSALLHLVADGRGVELAGSPATGFNLVVEQTDESWHQNVVASFNDVYGQILGLIPGSSSCFKAAKDVVLSKEFESALRARSVANLKGALRSDWLNWSKVVRDCSYAGRVSSRYVRLLSRKLSTILLAIDEVETAEKALTLLARFRTLELHSGKPVVVGVCQGKASDAAYTVVNCAETIEVGPFEDAAASKAGTKVSIPALLAGSTLTPLLVAKDAAGRPTLTPSALKFELSNPAVATLSFDAAGRASVTALSAGVSYLTVTDQATGAASGETPFYVVRPGIVAAKTKIAVDETTEIRLVDPLTGNTVFADRFSVVWESASPQTLVVSPFGSPTAITVRGAATSDGPVRVSARNSSGGLLGSVDVTVGDASEMPLSLAWREMRLPYRWKVDYGFAFDGQTVQCAQDEQVLAEGRGVFALKCSNPSFDRHGDYDFNQAYRVYLSPIRTFFKTSADAPDEYEGFLGLEDTAPGAEGRVAAHDGALMLNPLIRRDAVFAPLNGATAECTDSAGQHTGLLSISGSALWLVAPGSGPSKVMDLPNSLDDDHPFEEEWSVGGTLVFRQTGADRTSLEVFWYPGVETQAPASLWRVRGISGEVVCTGKGRFRIKSA